MSSTGIPLSLFRCRASALAHYDKDKIWVLKRKVFNHNLLSCSYIKPGQLQNILQNSMIFWTSDKEKTLEWVIQGTEKVKTYLTLFSDTMKAKRKFFITFTEKKETGFQRLSSNFPFTDNNNFLGLHSVFFT